MTIDQLFDALYSSWSSETAYRLDRENWSLDNKAVGQCTVTAMIVYDYFGGKIVRGYSEKYKLFHYWNELNGEIIDLTKTQFIPQKADIVFNRIEYKDKKSLLRIRDVRNRYQLLRSRVEERLSKK